MKSYIQEAEVLRLLLSYGCTSGAKIITWADETIVAESDIDDNLIELSTESPDKTPALLSRLTDLGAGADKHAALRIALGRMHDVIANDSPEDLAGFAANLGNVTGDVPQPLPEDLRFLNSLKTNAADPAFSSKDFLQQLKQFKGSN